MNSSDTHQRHVWLGIPPGDDAASDYRLLGLAECECDVEVIGFVSAWRIEFVESLVNGPDAAAAKALLARLRKARDLLLDPVRKARYDEQLIRANKGRRLPPLGATDDARRWLGVVSRSPTGPTDHELLGIAADETDRDVIQTQYDQRMSMLRRMERLCTDDEQKRVQALTTQLATAEHRLAKYLATLPKPPIATATSASTAPQEANWEFGESQDKPDATLQALLAIDARQVAVVPPPRPARRAEPIRTEPTLSRRNLLAWWSRLSVGARLKLAVTVSVVGGLIVSLGLYFAIQSEPARENQLVDDSLPDVLQRSKLDVVFLMDTTDSMDRYIASLKRKCADFVQILDDKRLDTQLALVGFGDVDFKEPLHVRPLTKSVQLFQSELATIPRTNGFDIPESALEAIEEGLKLRFRPGATVCFVLITDADCKRQQRIPEIARRLEQQGLMSFVVSREQLRDIYENLCVGNGQFFGLEEALTFDTLLDTIANTVATRISNKMHSPPATSVAARTKSVFEPTVPVSSTITSPVTTVITQPLRTLSGHRAGVYSVALARDGQTLVSGSGDRTVKLWDMGSGTCRLTCPVKNGDGHAGPVHCVAMTEDGLTVVSGSVDKKVKLWDARTGNCLRTLPVVSFEGHTDTIACVTTTDDGQTVISGSSDNTVKLWDATTGKLRRTLPVKAMDGHSSTVTSVAVTADGLTIVTGSADRTVKIWNARTGLCRLTLREHSEYVHSVAVTGDGQTVVSGSSDKTAKVWDARTGLCRLTLPVPRAFGHSGDITSVAITANGETVVTGSDDNTLRVWDARTGFCRHTLKGHSSYVASVAVTGDGQTVVSGSGDTTVKLWNISSLATAKFAKANPPAKPVAQFRDGATPGELESFSEHGIKMIWCPAGSFTMGSPFSEIGREGDEDQVKVTLSRGFWLGQFEVTQHLWKKVMQTTPWIGRTHTKDGAEYPVTYISHIQAEEFCRKLSQNERNLGRLPLGVSYRLPTEAEWEYACRAGTLTPFHFGRDAKALGDYAWWGGERGNGNAASEKYPHEIGQKLPNPWGFFDMTGNAWEWCSDWYASDLRGGRDPQGPSIVALRRKVFRGGGWNDESRCCRSADRAFYHPEYQDGSFLGFRLALSRDGSTNETASDTPNIPSEPAHIGVETLVTQPRTTLTGHTASVTSVAVTGDSQTVVSGSIDKTVKLWDVRTGTCRLTLQGHFAPVRCVAVAGDGQTVVSGSDDMAVKLWDARTGIIRLSLPVQRVFGHAGSISGVAIIGDGQEVVSGSADKTVKLWDARTGDVGRTLHGHTGSVRSATVIADSRAVVSGSEDATIKLWDAETGECRLTLQGHSGAVNNVAVTADGQTVISGSNDKTVKLWNVRTGTCRLTLHGHTSSVNSVAVTSDGQTVVSGSDDNNVKLWDARTGACRLTLQGHTGRVYGVAVTSDGQTVVSSASDKTVKLWDIPWSKPAVVVQTTAPVTPGPVMPTLPANPPAPPSIPPAPVVGPPFGLKSGDTLTGTTKIDRNEVDVKLKITAIAGRSFSGKWTWGETPSVPVSLGNYDPKTGKLFGELDVVRLGATTIGTGQFTATLDADGGFKAVYKLNAGGEYAIEGRVAPRLK